MERAHKGGFVIYFINNSKKIRLGWGLLSIILVLFTFSGCKRDVSASRATGFDSETIDLG